MIRQNTVLILGAGASAPYGFPTGMTLKQKIVGELQNTGLRQSILEFDNFNEDDVKTFFERLSLSPRFSVDRFLEQNRDLETIGKLAISYALIGYEQPKILTPGRAESGWYSYVYNQMGSSLDAFRATPLSIISFNYDRSLEFFLYRSLRADYNLALTDDQVKKLVRGIDIIHVHGQLGSPDFLRTDATPEGKPPEISYRDYENSTARLRLQASVPGIKIIYEAEGSPEFQQAHQVIAEADILAFIGFGYDSTNLARLKVNELFRGKRLLGSGFGLGADEKRRAKDLFEPRVLDFPSFPPTEDRILIGGPDEDALEFLRNYPIFDYD